MLTAYGFLSQASGIIELRDSVISCSHFFGGVNVIWDFPRYVANLSIPLPSATISTSLHLYPTLCLCVAAVLVYTAASDTSLASPLPPPAQSTLGRRGEGHTRTELAGKGPPGEVAVLAVSPNFAGWGEGTALPSGPSDFPHQGLTK